MCRLCLEQSGGVVTPATVADHVIPHRGDEKLFWFGELQSLCQAHHSRDKQQTERIGFSTAIGDDGFPTDPLHPANQERAGGRSEK